MRGGWSGIKTNLRWSSVSNACASTHTYTYIDTHTNHTNTHTCTHKYTPHTKGFYSVPLTSVEHPM